MDAPLETIAYLARSEHRVAVLDAVRREPRTREEIRSLTDASRVTAGRIIADLEEREWIARAGSRYEATPDGRYVAAEFTRLLRNLEAFDSLPPVVEWFPDGQPAFDLQLLDDATVVTADEGDLIAPIRRALTLIEGADELVAIANGASEEFVEAIRAAVEAGQTHTLVLPPSSIEALRDDPDLRSEVRRTLETDRATLLRYEGGDALPVVQIADGTVALCSGDHQAMVETDSKAVREWATAYVESLRAQATPVAAAAFAEPMPADEPSVE